MKELAIISGSSNIPLASKISDILGVPLTNILATTFGNGERRVEILENVRDMDCFVIGGSSSNTDGHVMELLLLLDTLRRSNCYRVTTVLPCFPYARGDRKMKSRTPIAAKLLANMITTAGTQRILNVELHCPQIGSYFDLPCDNLHSFGVFLPKIKELFPNNNVVVVAPDLGGSKVAKSYGGKLDCNVAMIYKHRVEVGKVADMTLVGDVEGKHAIIVDDIIDTSTTIVKAANLLMYNKAKSVTCFATHAVLSGNALDNIDRSPLEKVYVTDTIDNPRTKYSTRIEVLSVAPLLSKAISGVNKEESLSYLFDA
jgi:ribose-phosphate pyrophosphokinase